MILLIKLFLAHLIGDFLLQPNSWVEAKERKKLKAYQLYLHILLHGALIMVLVWDWNFLTWAFMLAIIHGLIDTIKLYVQSHKTRRMYFFADQLAHALSIYFVYSFYLGYSVINPKLLANIDLLLITLLIFLTVPVSHFIKVFISKWTPHTESTEKESLEDAGKFIGIFERLLVFIFVISNHWEAVGFLLAAKSVFRFGDLKEAKDRKLTEYILIGTLLSFGIAIVAGMGYGWIILKNN